MDVREPKGGEPSLEDAVVPAESKPTRRRKPYQKPSLQFERMFETMALSCGKVNPTQLNCRGHRMTS
jgi:hypothetical protein